MKKMSLALSYTLQILVPLRKNGCIHVARSLYPIGILLNWLWFFTHFVEPFNDYERSTKSGAGKKPSRGTLEG
jgi:hypothetical protein